MTRPAPASQSAPHALPAVLHCATLRACTHARVFGHRRDLQHRFWLYAEVPSQDEQVSSVKLRSFAFTVSHCCTMLAALREPLQPDRRRSFRWAYRPLRPGWCLLLRRPSQLQRDQLLRQMRSGSRRCQLRRRLQPRRLPLLRMPCMSRSRLLPPRRTCWTTCLARPCLPCMLRLALDNRP